MGPDFRMKQGRGQYSKGKQKNSTPFTTPRPGHRAVVPRENCLERPDVSCVLHRNETTSHDPSEREEAKHFDCILFPSLWLPCWVFPLDNLKWKTEGKGVIALVPKDELPRSQHQWWRVGCVSYATREAAHLCFYRFCYSRHCFKSPSLSCLLIICPILRVYMYSSGIAYS